MEVPLAIDAVGPISHYTQLETPRLAPIAVRMVTSVCITIFQISFLLIDTITIYHLQITNSFKLQSSKFNAEAFE